MLSSTASVDKYGCNWLWLSDVDIWGVANSDSWEKLIFWNSSPTWLVIIVEEDWDLFMISVDCCLTRFLSSTTSVDKDVCNWFKLFDFDICGVID